MMNFENRPIVEKTPERVAGQRYSEAMKVVDVGGHGLEALALHIPFMLGKNEWNRPIWQKRELKDGKVVELERFEDYLLKAPREGLKLPSLVNIDANLKTLPDGKGAEALRMLRQAIPDWDAQIAKQKVNSVPVHPKNGEVGRGRAKDDSFDNIKAIGGTSADYLTARIKRDHPDIAQRLLAGEFKSVRAAAMEAGIVKQLSQLEIAKKTWTRMNESERGEFLSWILNEA